MSPHYLLLYSVVWWVFVTIAAFLASVLFWNKGLANLSGTPPGAQTLKVRLTGAGAIWGFTLIVFFFIDPTKGYREMNTPELFDSGIDVSRLPGVDLSNGHVAIELINKELSFTLAPDGKNHLVPDRPMPAGIYEVRVIDTVTGETRSIMHLKVPAS
ncbi:MAG TPA: hypothetical protein VJ725_00925 [Thermoanaerobaculia bacterium]|nr:hypothetical protein [Thermoanaerobaculia bacterium]